MKTIKKSSLVFLSLLVLLAGFAMPALSSVYEDTSGHWAQAEIADWSDKGVVNGYDGKFRPNESITRAEFSTLLNNIMGYMETGENTFSDLSPEDWYYDAMIKLHAAGVLQGSAGQALPMQSITRQEAAVLMARAFHIDEGATIVPFKDQEDIAIWAIESVSSLAAKGVMNGRPDGSFDPTAQLTRAEAVKIISNIITELYSQPGEYSGDVDGNVVVNADNVVLNDMEISGDLFIAEGVGEGEVTLNNVVIDGTVIIEGGGENSIIFNNVQVRGALVVNKYNGQVRILATGNTAVSVTTLQNGAMIVTRDLTGGGFETIEISAEIVAGADIVLDGNFNRVVNYSPDVQISATGRIAELVAEVDTNITGEVVVDKVTSDEGVSATVNSGKGNDQSAPPASGGSGGSPGGGSGGNDGSPSKVFVTGVSIDVESVTLAIGEHQQLTANITPMNATNKNVLWEVVDGNADVASVDEEGLITALSIGTEVIRVTTEDGGYTDEVTIQVIEPLLGIEVSKYAGAAVDPESSFDGTILANSKHLNIDSHKLSVVDKSIYETIITADTSLEPNSAEEYLQGKYANIVITITGHDGQPIADPSDISVSVTEATYTTVTGETYQFIPQFGVNLAEGYKDGSFVFLINADDPEQIQQYDLRFSHDGYEDTNLTVMYVPAGFAYIRDIGRISGKSEVGTELTAGVVSYEGTPSNSNVEVTWLRADQNEGTYKAIDGANSSSYVLTEADLGKYIRVKVAADQVEVGGWAFSEAIGPVTEVAKSDDVYQAIEAVFLGGNSDVNNIVSNLNLITSLSAFPHVTISWVSSDESIVTNTGVVTRSTEADQQVTLTVTLDGASGDLVKEYNLIIKKLESDIELGEFIDPYFADDYPQAYIKDGTIWVKFKLDRPAEVFMIVNSMAGYWESSVKSVLEGHAGLREDEVYAVDSWPYFNVTDQNQVYEFDTEVRVDKYINLARVEFVIRDSNYISDKVTSIVFTQEIVDYVDTHGPVLDRAYINDKLDTVYLYFNEKLDLDSLPKPEDFILSHGHVTKIKLHNYEIRDLMASYVELSVDGINEVDRDNLIFNYTGHALKDVSLSGNNVHEIVDQKIYFVDAEKVEAKLSADRKIMNLRIQPGVNNHEFDADWWYNETLYAVNVKGYMQEFEIIDGYYGYDYFNVTLKFNNPLPDGNIEVNIDVSEMINIAMEPFTSPTLSTIEVTLIPAPGTPEVKYLSYGALELTFAEGYKFNFESYIGGMVIEVDGEEYALRGYIGSAYDSNKYLIYLNGKYEQHIKKAIESGSVVRIKYKKTNGENRRQITDAAGGLLPDFDYVDVIK